MATHFPFAPAPVFLVALSMWALLLVLLGVPPLQVLLIVGSAAALLLMIARKVSADLGRYLRTWAFALVFLVTGTAMAQDAVALSPATAGLLDSPDGAFRDFVVAVKKGDLWYAAAALLFAVVGFLRYAGKKLHAFIPDDTTHPVLRRVEDVLMFIYDTKLGGWFLNWATAIAGCLATVKMAGLAVDGDAWRAALVASTSGTAAIELWDDLKLWWPGSRLRAWLVGHAQTSALVLLAALVGLSGCTHKAGLLITGRTLLELEHQFSTVADAMDRGLDSGAVTADEYRVWRAFGERFQVAYPQAVSTWRKARQANDAALKGELGAAAGALIGELGGYVDLVLRLSLVPEGGLR